VKDRAEDLRDNFDRAFAAAPELPAPAHVDLLRVRVAGEPYAIVLSEIAGLHVDLHVVPMPSPAPELLGVVSVRNAIMPVYDLRAVLASAAGPPPRWLVIGRCTPVLGFAFDGFDGHARVGAHMVAKSTAASVRGALMLEGRAHQVIDLAVIAADILTRWSKKG
jgi:purine-binding chemotaxis protein CheW